MEMGLVTSLSPGVMPRGAFAITATDLRSCTSMMATSPTSRP